MGLFDKLKNAVNAVTGGSSKVTLEFLSEPELGEPFQIKVKATMQSDVKVRRVYIKLRSRELIEIPDYDLEVDMDGDVRAVRERITFDTELYSDEITLVDEESEYKSGETYEWECDITIPDDKPGSYDGEYASHIYEIQAGLDTFGNDPDSGWIPFEIY